MNELSEGMKSFQRYLYLIDPSTWKGGNGIFFNTKDFTPDDQKSRGGIMIKERSSFPSNWMTSTPVMATSSVSSDNLSKLLVSFNTNKFGPGIMGQMGGGDTKVIVSGEIRNYINDKDAGTIAGDKILTILQKQIA